MLCVLNESVNEAAIPRQVLASCATFGGPAEHDVRARGADPFGFLPKVFHNCGKHCGKSARVGRLFEGLCRFSAEIHPAKAFPGRYFDILNARLPPKTGFPRRTAGESAFFPDFSDGVP
jgi:hypothetical protein